MGKVKDLAMQVIQRLPDDATFDDVMYELYVNHQIQKGLDQLDRGEGISHEEVMKRLSDK